MENNSKQDTIQIKNNKIAKDWRKFLSHVKIME